MVWLCLCLALGAGFAQQGRLVFVAPDGQLMLARAGEQDVQRLTDTAGVLQFPAWSPDGAQVAAIGVDGEGGFVMTVLVGVAPVLREHYRSRSQAPFYLYWSPDASQLSFLANHPTAGIGLYLSDLVSPARLLSTGSPFYWQWTADSERLLIHSGFSGAQARLGFTSAQADTLSDNLAAPGFFQSPGISASGTFIAYDTVTADGMGRLRIDTLNPDNADNHAGNTFTPRELDHPGLIAFAWNPASDGLALMHPPQPAAVYYGPLQYLDVSTGLLEDLTTDPVIAFFWSPDGRYIAYLTPASNNAGDIAQPGTSPTEQHITFQPPPPQLELKLIDMTERSVREVYQFRPGRLFLSQFLPFFDQYALSHRVWSPDSQALALPVVTPEGATQVTIITVAGEVLPVAAGDMPFWSHQ